MLTQKSRKALLALACLAAIAIQGTALAADADKKGGKEREMARRMQQLQQEKSKLEQEKNELGSKATELEEKVKAANQAEGRARGEIGALRRKGTELEERLKATAAKSDGLARQLEETTVALRHREREKSQLETIAGTQIEIMARQARSLDACSARNAKLYQYGSELVGRFRTRAASAGDPLTGLGRVEAFDEYQAYRDKLDAEKTEAPSLAR